MAYQVGSQCFDSAVSALQAMAASMFGTGTLNGSPFSFYTVVDGANLVTISSNGAQTILTPQLIDCQLIGVSDASLLSFAVFAVLAIAFKFKAIVSTLHADHRGE